MIVSMLTFPQAFHMYINGAHLRDRAEHLLKINVGWFWGYRHSWIKQIQNCCDGISDPYGLRLTCGCAEATMVSACFISMLHRSGMWNSGTAAGDRKASNRPAMKTVRPWNAPRTLVAPAEPGPICRATLRVESGSQRVSLTKRTNIEGRRADTLRQSDKELFNAHEAGSIIG